MSSTTSSLVGYENNNEINNVKMKRSTTGNDAKSSSSARKKKGCCSRIHLNNLWSVWYGILGTILQGYITVKCVKRILGYAAFSWPENHPLPVIELNACLGLIGASVILLPFFFATAVIKIGNLANDGYKLGRQLSTCTQETKTEQLGNAGGCSIFKHGGPTAPFLHLVISFSLLLPRLLMDARLIEAGLLPQESIWTTDLDFMIVHRDRLVLLSFMTAPPNASALTYPSSGKAATEPTILLNRSTPFMNKQAALLNNPADMMNGPTALPFTNEIVKKLTDYIGHENQEYLNPHYGSRYDGSMSIEFINFALSLMVYSVRYPSLFWATNKGMGILFSFQLFINGCQTLLAYAGMSILYKVQIMGAWKVLPLLKHQPPQISLSGTPPFLLNAQVTLALYILSCLLVLSSSLILFLYGHTRFVDFLNHERDRKVIALKETKGSKWSYFTHCAALCLLISVGVCYAPLLHDYMIVYRGSLDGAVLVCIIGGIFHIFLWIVVWLFLTIKQRWVFKIRVTVGRATIKSSRSVKLVTDIDLASSSPDDPATQPLLVLGNGRTYSISENSPKKAIMSVIQKSALSKKVTVESTCVDVKEDEEQIYWLRPAISTGQHSPDEVKQLCWFKKKQKVTFNDNVNSCASR